MTDSNCITLYCVYRIVNFKTGQVYVGQARDFRKRANSHFSYLRRNAHSNQHLQNAYNKHGRGSFYIEIVESSISKDEINERETCWISYFDSFANGYNQTIGGGGNSGNRTPCSWNGVEYNSVADAARANNITTEAMKYRLSQGYTCDENVSARRKPCMWNGISYNSTTDAARANNITHQAMQYRISQGYTCDDEVPSEHNHKICAWNGIEYNSIREAAHANNIYPASMWHRLSQGWTCDSDLTASGNNRISCVWNGIQYPSFSAAAKALKMNRSTLQYRLSQGYTCDEDIK